MGELSKRATVYFEPEIHHALRVKAANTHQSVSEVVNEAVRLALGEDQEDLSAFEERVAEPTLSYEALLKRSQVAWQAMTLSSRNPSRRIYAASRSGMWVEF